MPAAAPRGEGPPGRDFAGHRLGEPGFRRIAMALFAAGLATFALLYSTQPLLPELSKEFGVSPASSALTVSLTTIGLGLALLVTGPVSETWGRTPLIHLSISASAIVGLLCAVAPSWPLLLALRALLGVVLAGLPAVAVAYLHDEVHEDSVASATGLYIGGTAFGGMAGRLLAGGLADVGGWRWALGGVGVLGLGCAVLVWLVLPGSRNFVSSPADPRSIASQTVGVVSDPALLALYATALTLMGGFVGVFNALGYRLAGGPYHLSVGVAGLVFVVYALGSISSAYAGSLADRFGRRAVEPVACLIMLAGLVLTLAEPLWLVVAGLAVMTGGFFAAHGVASGWVAARAAAGGRATGQATSLYLFGYYLGSSVFGALAGSAWTSGGWPRVVVLTGLLVTVGLTLSLILHRIPSLLEATGRSDPAAQ